MRRPYDAPANITGMNKPDGMAIPYVIMPRKYMAKKKKTRLGMRNSWALSELNRLRMASSLVVSRSEARSL